MAWDALYRQRADIAPSLIVVAVLVVQLLAVAFVEDVTTLLCIAAALLMFSACPGSISHNHHHYPTFRRQWQNRIYEVILFLETGIPPFAWTLHHNLGHHKHYLDQKLDPAAWQESNGKVMNRIKFDLYNAWRVYPEVIRIGRQRPRLLARFYRWAVVSLAVLALLLWWKPVAAAIIFLLPMPIMLLGLLDNTYQQHQGLDTHSDLTASRNSTSRLYNLISWNLGYHTAHHMHPSTHWSKLPELHASLEHRIPDDLICNSVFLSDCGKPQSPLLHRPKHQGLPASNLRRAQRATA